MSWLVGRRSENQRLLLHILKFADGRPRPSRHQAAILQLLIGATFSLWRAVFLADGRRSMTSIHSKALGFLKVLVQENAITFQQDRKHNDWTFGYYLNNAYFRLQLAYKKLPSIDQRGDSNLRAVVDEVLDAQVGLANHNEQAETDWENAHKAAEDIFKALAAKNTRRRKGRRRTRA